jgi:eukaryotic-like serine/threonine-protein kinase
LPDSIRFWKTRIEELDAEQTFSVGLIYGPSGCGKSSLVKAGLLPRLSEDVIPVYVETTAEETETRLLNGLRKRCPALPDNLGLKETLAALRRGQGIPLGKKVLIVLDQFEQWLHAKKEEPNTELVQALRQCDGARVQSIVMVRDDFWMAATRFMRDLDFRLLEGQNSAAVDLFPIRHAEKVLAAFGRAFGILPDVSSDASKDQKQFLEQAVSGLAQEGKVICVRLALFAEMMKGKAWTPASLKQVGGTEGVGITFLEETFSAATAPPEHRYHQKAARADLKVLLPETGSDLKGHMRSYAELLEASGYGSRPKDFDDLLRILDNEIRLITPTDPEGKDASSDSVLQTKPRQKYYQLTHDYLVHSIREWLTHKQRETRRGRAELRLVERAALWNAKPENRHLPAWWEWVNIRLFTRKKTWTQPQRNMMRETAKYFSVRLFFLASVLTLSAWGLFEGLMYWNANNITSLIKSADTSQIPQYLPVPEFFERWTTPLLRQLYAESTPDSKERLHASLALLPVDATQVDYLYGRLLKAAPHEVPVIRDALAPYKDALIDKLWTVMEKPENGKEPQRLRAAAALAKYDPESERWDKASKAAVEQLVAENPVFLGHWMEGFRPIKGTLLTPMASIYRDTNGRESERFLATNILADYAADNTQLLADLLMDADEKQFAAIFPKIKDCGEEGLSLLTAAIDKKLPPELPSSDNDREKLAKRQANAAVALLRMNQPVKVWPLLKHSPDPRVRSYLIHRLAPLGADAKAIVNQFEKENEITIRRALVLSLGEYGEKDFTLKDREALLPKLHGIYSTDTDPGLHAAVEWLLRTWKKEGWLKQENDKWAKHKEGRETKVAGIKELVGRDKEKTPPQWYVNGQGQTMVVIPGPVEFMMGSPESEKDRNTDEGQHQRGIGRTFALAATSVTKEQFLRFRPTFSHGDMKRYPDPTCPIGGVTWYEAAAYCNWLSKEEGILEDQWCYLPNDKNEYADGMRLAPDYLKRTGYRLPTEAEMEYATRAGALTSRHYGETEELLPKYAWYTKNSQERTWPVGRLKPNDLGFFDVHGNVYTWCQEKYKPYPQGDEASNDKEDDLVIAGTLSRVLRGGSLFSPASIVRSAVRNDYVPTNRYSGLVGFRPARTFPP